MEAEKSNYHRVELGDKYIQFKNEDYADEVQVLIDDIYQAAWKLGYEIKEIADVSAKNYKNGRQVTVRLVKNTIGIYIILHTTVNNSKYESFNFLYERYKGFNKDTWKKKQNDTWALHRADVLSKTKPLVENGDLLNVLRFIPKMMF